MQPEPECLRRALGQVGQGGMPVKGDPLRRAVIAAGAEQLCRPFPCGAESPREGQRPAVSAGDRSPARGASEVPRAIGWPPALLSSRGGVMPRRPIQFLDPTALGLFCLRAPTFEATRSRIMSPPAPRSFV